ncbi:MAG: HIT family protein [bacterium]|nr:HIT family protein [bacterium]
MEDCIFCKIINREIPADIVYEDEYAVAFLDIRPVSKGHTLLVPKNHSHDLLDSDDETLKNLMFVVKKVSRALLKATGAKAFNLGTNNGEDAGQDVFHLHFHLIPRYKNDQLKGWPHHESDAKDRVELAEHIREFFGN